MATAPKKRSYSIKEKCDIIKAVDEAVKSGVKYPKSSVATRYNISTSTLSTFLKSRDKILNAYEAQDFHKDRKRMRKSPYADVEAMLFLNWFKQKFHQGIPISGPLLQTKADELATLAGHPEFKCSNGWLTRFKERHDILFKTINGEEQAVQEEDMQPWLEQGLPEVVQDLQAEDTYNADETGLFWRLLLDKTLAVKGDKCSGWKKSKERVTA